MGIFDKDKVLTCGTIGKEGKEFSCDIKVGGEEKTIVGTPPQIADEIARQGITEITGTIPKKLEGYVKLATNPAMQDELDEFEKLAMKRQIMDERAKGFPEEREFLDRVKNEVTGPIDVKRMKEIGLERIAKFTSEEKRKMIK